MRLELESLKRSETGILNADGYIYFMGERLLSRLQNVNVKLHLMWSKTIILPDLHRFAAYKMLYIDI